MSSELHPTSQNEKGTSPYVSPINAVWEIVEATQKDFSSMGSFRADRYDDEVHHARFLISKALSERRSHENGEAFRDYHQLGFLHGAVDALVYAPQLSSGDPDEIEYYTSVFSQEIQLASSRAMLRLWKERLPANSADHREYRAGLSNEFAVINLLNRPIIARQMGKIALPGTRKEDARGAIDAKQIDPSNPDETVLIQVKSRRRAEDRPPRNGIIVYGDDFNPRPHAAANDIASNETSSGTYETQLDGYATALHDRVTYLNRPDVRHRQYQRYRRAVGSLRSQNVPRPMQQKIGLALPELQGLLDELETGA